MELPGLTQRLYEMSRQEAHSKGICIKCKQPIEGRTYSGAGKREYQLTALCEHCFDAITAPPDEPSESISNPELLMDVTERTYFDEDEYYAKTIQQDHALFAQQYLRENELDNEFEVRIGKENELMLDYDCTETPHHFFVALDILRQAIASEYKNIDVHLTYEISVSKSGNIHAIVTLPVPMSIYERIAWQACFGADPKSNALQLLSVARNEKNPILLYERKKTLALPPAPEPLQLVEYSENDYFTTKTN